MIYPVPEIAWDIAKTNYDFFKKNAAVLADISIPYSDFEKRNRLVHQIFSRFEAHNRFVPIRPEHIFCNSFEVNRCVAQHNTVPFYYDDDHLSDVGARHVVSVIMEQMAKLNPG